ncbi:4Fe-4S dicluster domain-containing protein [Bradymonas sediminis]|uniref:Uncharacterized protein n=1 Tax=Bradymonas sediminis TaxID=1548548 RepID=A0A2Z4FLY1_9DELT|nr:4Fe-4S dicluster domain-containing protein [Bradymonas sediminis]AWV89973.1 hypothetical protein DN745_11750 [Bradymonas sediminis]TDP76073.1 MauM/NapG family ferredoxin protein [Bradymonas sediminis]
MFDWFKKKDANTQSDADEKDEKRRYNRRQFLRGSFVRDALDFSEGDAASGAQQASAPNSGASGHQKVDLLAFLGQLDPHSSERQLPPGVDEFNPRPRGTIPVVRPPGAVAEHDFLQFCTLCDACLDACPHDSIVAAPARFREAAGTPMIDLLDNPCRMCADTPCINACETGALVAIDPAALAPEEKPVYKIGLALLQQYNCLAYNHSFCTVCAERCPHEGAIILDQGKPRIVAEHCTGCGVCHSVCPAPMNAMMVMPNPSRPPAQRPE